MGAPCDLLRKESTRAAERKEALMKTGISRGDPHLGKAKT